MEDHENTPKKESPIEKALAQLKKEISVVQDTTTILETILSAVLTNPEKPTDKTMPETETQVVQTSLESRLNSMTCEVMRINSYLRDVQNRIQL